LRLLLILAALSDFANPARVTITGWPEGAMEPFLSRDGSILIFNNSNNDANTDLHWAERVDDLTFVYRGKVDGANSPELDGVGSMDREGNFYFVTTRSYFTDLMTIYRGRFDRGGVTGTAPVPGITRGVIGQLNFDVEVSGDGSALYFTDGVFTGGSVPVAADLALAVRGSDGGFRRSETDLFRSINSSALEYAAAISEDELELFFTRLDGAEARIYRSTRASITFPWGQPKRVEAIEGFAEGPTIGPGGTSLYYHARRDGRMVIERVTRHAKRRAVKR
jgi:hypothetical protein